MIAGFSLDVQSEEMVAIVGPSGAGKSTLLNILGLLDSADRGEVFLFGKPAPGIRSKEATALLRYRLAYLFQNYALIDNESVMYNLRLAQRYSRESRAEKERVLDGALRAVGLADAASKKVFQLSGGEQQRIAIARLFLKPCDLILADEPTGSLDHVNRDSVLTALGELRSRGKTVIIVTHDPDVVAVCDRSIVLSADSVLAAPLVPAR